MKFFYLFFALFVSLSKAQNIGLIPQNLCHKDVNEDVCSQKEGFDIDCDRRCSQIYSMKIGSICRSRQTGSLLSIFGIQSFVCTCQLSSIACSNPQLAVLPFNIVSIQQHSILTPIKQQPRSAVCSSNSQSSSLSCYDHFDHPHCGWIYSKEFQWYTARSNGLPHPADSPGGTYLASTSRSGTSSWASISTCDGLCSKASVNFTAKIWRSANVVVELCFKEKDATMCAPVHSSNGNLINEIIPETQYFQILLRFSNITNGDMILVDNLSVQYQPCSVETSKIVQANKTAQVNKSLPLHINQIHSSTSTVQRRMCQKGECGEAENELKNKSSNQYIQYHPLSSSQTKMCVGRPGLIYCRQKCKALDTSDDSARCVRQKENPLVKKCICHVRRSPVRRVDGPTTLKMEEVETNRILSDDSDHKMSSMLNFTSSTLSTTSVKNDEKPDEAEAETFTNLTCDSMKCQQNCGPSKIGICSDKCECKEKEPTKCEENICNFEKNTKCKWADLRMLSAHFNNISVAMKRGDENRYGISRLRPQSYSGLLYKTQLNGPIFLSIDIFPSHEIDVRICVQNLKKCQTQTISPKSWNRVSARIKVEQVEKIFILFYNSSEQFKSIAIDNIVVQNGSCP